MRKGSLATIKARPKLRTTTKNLGNRDNKGPNMGSKTLARDSTQHNIPIPRGKKRGTLILEQLLQNPPTPLQGGERRQEDLKTRGKYKQANALGNRLGRAPRIRSSPPAPKLAERKHLARELTPGSTPVTPIPLREEADSVRESKVAECNRANVESEPPSCSAKWALNTSFSSCLDEDALPSPRSTLKVFWEVFLE